VVSSTPRPHFTSEKDPVPIVKEAGWAPGPVWTGVENLAPSRIRSSDRPIRSSVAIPTELLKKYSRYNFTYSKYIVDWGGGGGVGAVNYVALLSI